MAAAVADAAGRNHVLRLYRHFLGLSKRLPDAGQREEAVKSVREGFRQHAGEAQPDKIEALLHTAESKLGFLKIVTPGGAAGAGGGGGGGRTRLVYREGKALEGTEANKRSRAPHSNWDGRNLDPDSVRHHQSNLRRAGFANHGQVLGPHGF